jgi:hypothetical protein
MRQLRVAADDTVARPCGAAKYGRKQGGATMLGLMQDWPLRIHSLIDHAARHHGGRRVVSRSVEGPFHETDWRTLRGRALRLAQRLSKEG